MKKFLAGSLGTVLSAMGTVLQTSEVLQIISLVITIIGGIVTLIILPILSWYQKAKKDGKITSDEIKDGVDTLQKGIDELTNVVDSTKKKEDK